MAGFDGRQQFAVGAEPEGAQVLECLFGGDAVGVAEDAERASDGVAQSGGFVVDKLSANACFGIGQAVDGCF